MLHDNPHFPLVWRSKKIIINLPYLKKNVALLGSDHPFVTLTLESADNDLYSIDFFRNTLLGNLKVQAACSISLSWRQAYFLNLHT